MPEEIEIREIELHWTTFLFSTKADYTKGTLNEESSGSSFVNHEVMALAQGQAPISPSWQLSNANPFARVGMVIEAEMAELDTGMTGSDAAAANFSASANL